MPTLLDVCPYQSLLILVPTQRTTNYRGMPIFAVRWRPRCTKLRDKRAPLAVCWRAKLCVPDVYEYCTFNCEHSSCLVHFSTTVLLFQLYGTKVVM